MPRGFLVKRYNKISSSSTSPSSPPIRQRVRRYSDEDRSDSSSDHDVSDGLSYCERQSRSSESSASALVIHHGTPSPLLHNSKSQDEPLSLTTGKDHGTRCPSPIFPITRSVLYFPRLEKPVVGTPPRPKVPSTPPLTAPYPPKKRTADSSVEKAEISSSSISETKTTTDSKVKPPKRSKVIRKLNFDEDKSSPVSGTFIRDLESDDDMLMPAVRRGDIDPSLNLVVVTEEARAELAKIENKIGDYVCQLCKEHYPDAFGLAQHRCSRIVHVEYRCPECDKVFNCPANLASHRRWHKPRPVPAGGTKSPGSPSRLPPNATPSKVTLLGDPEFDTKGTELGVKQETSFLSDPSDTESLEDSPSPGAHSLCREANEALYAGPDLFECETCGKKFRLQQQLRKHLLSHITSPEGHDKETADLLPGPGLAKRPGLRASTPPIDADETMDFTCPACDVSCGTRHEFEKHVLEQHAIEGITCKYCPCIFYSSAGLTRHINKYHPSENRQVILLQIPAVRPVST